MRKPITATDVRKCYIVFWGREPESDAAVAEMLAKHGDLWSLIRAFMRADDFRAHYGTRRVLPPAYDFASYDPRDVHFEATSDELQALEAHVTAVWSQYGETEPYASVLSESRFSLASLDAAAIKAFYASGADDVQAFYETCRRNNITPDPAWSVLELGCGCGRLAEHFAARAAFYTGVDVSPGHLQAAARRAVRAQVHTIRYMFLQDFVAAAPTYDVFFSLITLQHNPPPIMRELIASGLKHLRPRGVAWFQLPCHLFNYRYATSRYLSGEGMQPDMEMHALPQHEVFALLHAFDCQPVEVNPCPKIGNKGLSYAFLARKR